MKLQFEKVGRERLSFAVEVEIDYRAQPEQFERALKKEFRARNLTRATAIDCMPTTTDGSEGIVFAGRTRAGEWHRAGA